MAFVKIHKGDKHLTVPKRAYDKQYAPAGWKLEDELSIEKHAENAQKEEIPHPSKEDENALKNPHEEEHLDDEDEEENDEDEEDSDFDMEELEEKPLSELSVLELRALAEHKGIDISGLTTAKKLRDAIKRAS